MTASETHRVRVMYFFNTRVMMHAKCILNHIVSVLLYRSLRRTDTDLA